MSKQPIRRFVMATIIVILLGRELVPGMTEAANVTVASGRVKINGEIITDYVSGHVLAATGNATQAAFAVRLVQNALNEAILALHTQRDRTRWPRILEAVKGEKRRVLLDIRQNFLNNQEMLIAHDRMAAIILNTLTDVQSLSQYLVFMLQPQAIPAAQPPVAPLPSQVSEPLPPPVSEPSPGRRGQPRPGCRLGPNPATNGLNWYCP